MTTESTMNPAPPKVRLYYHGAEHQPGDEKPLMVEAFDAHTGETVGYRPLKVMETWLKANGYQWQTGSRAVWVR